MRAARPRATVVCVIGMHRSGTSLTMGILHRLGVYLGRPESLMKPSEHNPEGYWENEGFVQLNDELLARLGGSWDAPPDPQPGWASSPLAADLLARARGLVRREFAGQPLWGWKDPRTSLLLPFWQAVVPSPRYVLCVRNPLDVAASLGARDGFPLPRSAELWLRYTARCLQDTAGQPCLVVHYEDYFDDLEAQVRRLALFAGVDPPSDPAPLRSFLRADLRHHHHGLEDVLGHPELPLPVKFLYHALRVEAGGACDRARLVAQQAEKAYRAEVSGRKELAALAEQHAALWDLNRRLIDDLQYVRATLADLNRRLEG